MDTLQVEILVYRGAEAHQLTVEGPPSATVGYFLEEALKRIGLPATTPGVTVFLGSRPLPREQPVLALLLEQRTLRLTVLVPAPGVASDSEFELPPGPDSSDLADTSGEFELGLDCDASGGPASGSGLVEESSFDVPALDDELAEDSQVVSLEEDEPAPAPPAERPAPGSAPSLRDEEDDGEEAVDLDESTEDEEPRFEARPKMSLPPAAGLPQGGARRQAPTTTRHATVRYYSRMNPDRLYPLVFALTREEVQAIVAKNVQQVGKSVEVRRDATLSIVPVLPGCDCYPPSAPLDVSRGDVTLTFYVSPRVLGPIHEARVEIHDGPKKVAELFLEARVCQQAVARLLGVAGLCLPFSSAVLRHYKVDFESQLGEGFSVYLALLQFAVNSLSPSILAALLLLAAVLAYVWFRPRRQVVLWDLKQPVVAPAEPALGRIGRSAWRFGLTGAACGLGFGLVALGVATLAGSTAQGVRLAPLLLGGLPALGLLGGAAVGAADGLLSRD